MVVVNVILRSILSGYFLTLYYYILNKMAVLDKIKLDLLNMLSRYYGF